MPNPLLQDLELSIGDLPALPATVAQLPALLRDTTCSDADVVTVIERDPATAADVLKLVNSAFADAEAEFSSVSDAVAILGHGPVVALAFAMGMAPVMRHDLPGYGITGEDFWGHALQTAAASAIVAEHLGTGERRCDAFAAGLVHDLGMLVVDAHLVANHEVIGVGESAFTVRTIERRALGFDHTAAGAMLGRHWGLPEALIAPVRFHHEMDRGGSHGVVVRAVTVGNILAQAVAEDLDVAADGFARSVLSGPVFTQDFLAQLRLDLSGNLAETLVRATHPAHAMV